MSGNHAATTEAVGASDCDERRLGDLAGQGDLDGVRKALLQGVDPCWQVCDPFPHRNFGLVRVPSTTSEPGVGLA